MAKRSYKALLEVTSKYNASRLQQAIGLLENIEASIPDEGKEDFYEAFKVLKNLKTYNSGDW